MDEEIIGKALCANFYASYLFMTYRGAWKPTKLHKFLAETVQNFVEKETGHPYDILLISIPPQLGKSTTITEALPSWYLGKHPSHRVIEISYNTEFASRFCRGNRRKLEEFGKELFGLEMQRVRDDSFELKNHIGSFKSVGWEAGVTGNPCNLMIIDDPVKNRAEAESKTTREKLWAEWEDSMRTRLQPNSKVIVIMTRWHEDDLYGRMLEREKNVTRINIPLEAEDGDVLGREIGEPICPEIGRDAKWMQSVKDSCGGGNRTWYALYQGNPIVQGGNIFREAWFQEYETDMVAMKYDFYCLSVDCTFKDGSKNDFVSMGVWGKLGANCYLLDNLHQHLDFVQTVEAIQGLLKKWKKCKTILIEDKANGSAVIQSLRRHLSGIIPVTPDQSKEARAYAVTDYFQAGNIWIPKYASWKDAYVNEMIAFPNASHDDQVDMTTQAISHLMKKPELRVREEKNKLQQHRDRMLRRKRR